MADMSEILERVARTPNSSVKPPAGELPTLPGSLTWPADIREFYWQCGGVTLFSESAYRVDIVPPENVLSANQVILGEEFEDDRSSKWVIVAELPNSDHITMDLDPDRIGRCYDSSHERHGVVGSCPVVATSFAHLLESLLAAGGGYWYWLEDDFKYLGDAYD